MRTRIAVVVLTFAAVVLNAGLGWGQEDKDKITSLLDTMREAIVRGDAQAMGELLSDSGFVAVMPGAEGTKSYNKAEFVDLLKEMLAEGGAEIALEETKIDTHWLVALVTAKLRLQGDPTYDGLLFDAVLLREGGNWRVASLLVTPKVEEPGEEAVREFIERVERLPESLKRGDTDLLADAIDDDHFVLCFVDPAYELRWANSKTALTQILQSVIPMITVNESRLDVSRTVLGTDAAVVDGTWFLDIPDLGQTKSALRAHAVRSDGKWRVVAIAGGPQG